MVIVGNPSNNSAGHVNVTADYALKVAPTTTLADTGVVQGAGNSGSAADYGGSLIRSHEVDSDWKLRVGQDVELYNRSFAITVQTPDYQSTVNTHTMTWTVANNLLLNANSSLSGNSIIQTFEMFTVPIEGTIYAKARFKFTSWGATNNNVEFGLRNTAIGTLAPTNGVFLRFTAGELKLYVVANSVDIATSAALATASVPNGLVINETNNYVLGISRSRVNLWINNNYFGGVDIPPAGSNMGISQYSSLTMFLQNAHTTTGVGVQQVSVSDWSVSSAGVSVHAQMPASHIVARCGAYSWPRLPLQQATGGNWTNSLAVPTASLSNTAVSTTGWGGIFKFAATASGATDYVLQGLTQDAALPVHGATYIWTGASVFVWSDGAVNSATVPTTLFFAASAGSSGISLATSSTVTGREPARATIGGIQVPINAVVGQAGDRNIEVTFESPLAAPPGTFAQFIMRIASGAATASQFINVAWTPRGYWAL